jgi:hypothetical protein
MSSPDKRPKRRRRLVIAALAIPAGVLALWAAIHHIPGFGPLLADTARAIAGPDAVAKLEDFAYGVEDRINQVTRGSEQPASYWEVPSTPPPPPPPVAAASNSTATLPPFRPADVPAVHASWSAPGDGVWLALDDPRRPGDAPVMWKTLLHPDRLRSWTAVMVVAVDLRFVDLHLMAGRHEPESDRKEAKSYERKALIPETDHASLIAAFNGGFKTTHGHYGMKIDGVTLVGPRKDACTVIGYDGGRVEIRSWSAVAETEATSVFWRQTPACMVELGKMHPGLSADSATFWGATLDRETVIRRSAVGLSQDGQVLYVGIGDATTAGAIARAMSHAGAYNVAQLDVNYSYPKFLLYRSRAGTQGELIAEPLAKGFEFTEDEYLRTRAPRDFFYLTRRVDPRSPPKP